ATGSADGRAVVRDCPVGTPADVRPEDDEDASERYDDRRVGRLAVRRPAAGVGEPALPVRDLVGPWRAYAQLRRAGVPDNLHGDVRTEAEPRPRSGGRCLERLYRRPGGVEGGRQLDVDGMVERPDRPTVVAGRPRFGPGGEPGAAELAVDG